MNFATESRHDAGDYRKFAYGLALLLQLSLAAVSTSCTIKSDSNQPPYPDALSFCQGRGRAECNTKVLSQCAATSISCVSARTQACVTDVGPIQVSHTFQPDQAEGCIKAVEAAYADATVTPAEQRDIDKVCALLFNGTRSSGGSCQVDADCKVTDKYLCVFPAGGAQGTCQVPTAVGPGQPCPAPADRCAVDFYCGGNPSPHCLASQELATSCDPANPCKSTLRCASTGKCVPKLTVGASCATAGECASGICLDTSPSICVDQITLGPSEPFCVDVRRADADAGSMSASDAAGETSAPDAGASSDAARE